MIMRCLDKFFDVGVAHEQLRFHFQNLTAIVISMRKLEDWPRYAIVR
jgi:hypothetical protein